MKFEKSVSTICDTEGGQRGHDGGGTTGLFDKPQVVRRAALARSSPAETVVNYERGGERVIVKGKIGPFRSRIC